MGRTTEIGNIGESFAAAQLQAKGYKILCTNFRCKMGEIDIIAQDGSDIVFIEVRTRGSGYLVSPAETVTYQKQQRILRTAQLYLQQTNCSLQPRFDVFAIVTQGPNSKPWQHEHIENAF